MKKILYFFVLVLLSSNTFSQLNGIKTINPSGSGTDNYTSFNAAINAINSAGTTTGVTFLISGGTYTETSPMLINIGTNKPTSLATVTFKPAPGATVILNVGGQNSSIKMALRIGSTASTTNYIILDGSNTEGGTSRDWTIKSTAATYGIEPLEIYGDYITIKNCIIDMNSAGYTGYGYGITLREASPTATNCVIQNNYITSNYGISVGRGTSNDLSGHLIKGNEIHCLNNGIYSYRSSTITIEDNLIVGDVAATYPSGTCTGIYIGTPTNNLGNIIVRNNTIRNLAPTVGSSIKTAQLVIGIWAGGAGTYTIEKNHIYNLYNSTAGINNPTTYGMYFTAAANTSTFNIFNNSIYNILNDDPDPIASLTTCGMRLGTSGNFNVFNNTIIIPETTRDCFTAGITVSYGDAIDTVKLKNNIIVVENTSPTYRSCAIYKISGMSSTLVSNNNLLYAPGSTNCYIGYDDTNTYLTLLNWQGTGYDSNSKSKAVNFTADYHITGASLGDVDLLGVPIAGITTDIDGDSRSLSSPYKGSDEAAVPLPVQLNSFSYSISNSNVILNWVTSTEVSSYGFEVLKSDNQSMENASIIGFVNAAGNSNSSNTYTFIDKKNNSSSYYQLKMIDNNGSYKLSSILKVKSANIIDGYSLEQNFPNPFNPTTTISYSLPFDCNVTLSIYSIIGEQIKEIKSFESAGTHHINFNAESLNSGVFLYKLSVVSVDGKSNFSQTKKMTLIK